MKGDNNIGSFPSVPRKVITGFFTFTASFGKKQGNTEIKQEDIEKFIKTEMIAQLKGFKIVETRGVWKGQKEDSFDIVVTNNESGMMGKLREICWKYAKKFGQESVLLVF